MASKRYHNYYVDCAVCFWTSSIVAGIPALRGKTAARMLLAVWEECRVGCNVKLIGYVIMPNHIHIAVWAESARDVQRFIQQSLGIASARIAAMAERAAERGDLCAAKWLAEFKARARGSAVVRVWKERGRAFPVTELKTLAQKLDYMHNNPVRKGLVARAEDWEFSSAGWYADRTGPIRIDDLDL